MAVKSNPFVQIVVERQMVNQHHPRTLEMA
jgi:hypothetical protein